MNALRAALQKPHGVPCVGAHAHIQLRRRYLQEQQRAAKNIAQTFRPGGAWN
jgi:hypothetical protein